MAGVAFLEDAAGGLNGFTDLERDALGEVRTSANCFFSLDLRGFIPLECTLLASNLEALTLELRLAGALVAEEFYCLFSKSCIF